MTYESFTYSVTDFANIMTEQHHQTLAFLYEQDYITADDFENLTATTLVVPVKNTKSLGFRILEKFFKHGDKENSYTFVISTLHNKDLSKYKQQSTASVTKLTKVVDNEN